MPLAATRPRPRPPHPTPPLPSRPTLPHTHSPTRPPACPPARPHLQPILAHRHLQVQLPESPALVCTVLHVQPRPALAAPLGVLDILQRSGGEGRCGACRQAGGGRWAGGRASGRAEYSGVGVALALLLPPQPADPIPGSLFSCFSAPGSHALQPHPRQVENSTAWSLSRPEAYFIGRPAHKPVRVTKRTLSGGPGGQALAEARPGLAR